jgi:diguanylate cyclase (GGDEF)-like protein
MRPLGILQRVVWRFCLFAVLLCTGTAHAQADLPLDFLCGRETIFASGQLLNDLPWQASQNNEVVVPQNATCWLRFSRSSGMVDSANGTSFLRITQEQGQEIFLYRETGKMVGSALQNGENYRSISSQTLAAFPIEPNMPHTLYAKVRSSNIQYSVRVSVDERNGTKVISNGQKRDAISAGMMAFLMAAGLLAALYAYLHKGRAYALFSLYALFTSVQIFGNYSVSLPFGVNTANLASLLAEPASNIVLVQLVLYVGKFAEHSRWCMYALRLIIGLAGVQIVWLVLLAVGLTEPSPLSDWYYFFQYDACNILSLAIVWGGINGWRHGVKIGLPLAVGTAPRALLWMAHSEAINVFLFGGWPNWAGFTDPAGVIGLLALPVLFLGGIAWRSRDVQRELVRLARQDQLTGLPNRDRLIQIGSDKLAKGVPLSVLVINVDRFKAINDVLGYHAGDAVMIQVGQRLASIPHAMVGRNQGTQFCLLWRLENSLDALQQQLRLAFAQPVSVLDQLLDVSLSVGVAQGRGEPVATTMRNAEVALEAAKKTKVEWVLYDPLLETSKPENLTLLTELNLAISQDQLLLFLQPKVRMGDGNVSSAEALIRWKHPTKGMVPPGDFIPFAEQTGKISAITLWALREAAKFTKVMRERGSPLSISVNISTHDLRDAGFVTRAVELLQSLDAQPSDIRLEVTESGIMDDPETSLVTLHNLRSAGFTLSIDDFGTGYSSLSYLQKMPVSEVKIDRSFVRHVVAGSDGAALLDSILALGHRLGLTVVAEGAESAEEWFLLNELGCDFVQGWFVAKAMPLEEFLIWQEKNNPFIPTQ